MKKNGTPPKAAEVKKVEASKEAARVELRNRIIGSGMISPKKLMENPDNWRGHPLKQEQVVEGALEEVGWVRGILINKRTGNMVDGHLRAKIAKKRGEKLVPYEMIDVSLEEERVILATLDPSSEMAEMNKEVLRPLLDKITVGSAALQKLLSTLEEEAGVENTTADTETLFEQSVQLQPNREYVVIVCANDAEWDGLRERLQLKTVRRGGYKRGSAFDATSIERVIPAARFLKKAGGKKNDNRSAKQRKTNASSHPKNSAGLRGIRPSGGGEGLRAGEGAEHRSSAG